MRLLILSDFHCGHVVGLTPPAWWRTDCTGMVGGNQIIAKQRAQQEERWNWYANEIDKVKKEGAFDYLCMNGDAIDGSSARIGGAEKMEVLQVQVDMAEVSIKYAITPKKTKGVFMSSGTNYHTRSSDGAVDMELALRRQVDTFIKAQYSPIPYLRIGGDKNPFILKCRHHTSRGTIRSGGAIPGAARQMVDSILASKLMGDPDVDLIALSHVHEASFVQMFQANGRPLYVLTTPALQGRGSEYGMKMCNGVVHFGFVVLEIEQSANGGWDISYEPHIIQLVSDRVEIFDLK